MEGEDRFETGAPVALMSTLCSGFELNTEEYFELESTDVGTEYLKELIERELSLILRTELSPFPSSTLFARRL